MFSPPGPDDDIPFKDFFLGTPHSAGKINKIIQEPCLDVIKDDPEAIKDELKEILGDEVTQFKDAPPIGNQLHSVDFDPYACDPNNDAPLLVPRHLKGKVDVQGLGRRQLGEAVAVAERRRHDAGGLRHLCREAACCAQRSQPANR